MILGYSDYTFINYVSHIDRYMSLAHDQPHDDAAAAKRGAARVRRLKCTLGFGNGTMLVANSIKDIAHILTPLGNVTNWSEPGNCAVVMFYKRTAPVANVTMTLFSMMPVLFPDLRIGAIDSTRFHLVNSEFGIIGVPTIMLFHEGEKIITGCPISR